MSSTYIGTAGWTVPREHEGKFASDGSHLERYASALNTAEINSSFYREHQASTYQKWAAMVPEDFRFAVKLSKTLTHEKRLVCRASDIKLVLLNILELKEKLGVILVQLPPSLVFEEAVANKFFTALRKNYSGLVACEARNTSWLKATDIFKKYKVARVLADPDLIGTRGAKSVNLAAGLAYFRLHGRPKIYKSSYSPHALTTYSKQIKVYRKSDVTAWCIFDNTMFGHATQNAITLTHKTSSKKAP